MEVTEYFASLCSLELRAADLRNLEQGLPHRPLNAKPVAGKGQPRDAFGKFVGAQNAKAAPKKEKTHGQSSTR